PISREYASAGVTWELDVGVYYGPNPWDASETQTQVYGTHGSTDAYPYPTSSLAFQTLAAPTAVLGELTWTSTSGEADLDVGLYILQTDCANDSCHYGAESVTFVDAEGGTGAPDDPAYVLLRGESLQKVLEKCRDGGECQMWVGASSHDCPEDVVFGGQDCPSPSIQWRMAATVFHAEVPEGFTAFDVFPS
ncbi:MAG: hypothetical protein QOJ26_474, partial [Thermoplasmata archaeon]|nr:hypothetical protein [Thermoplasmata archaeon]